MTRPAVFFDRDNTLIVNPSYLGDPEKVVLMPGAPAAVARCRAMGFSIVVVSNQSGVARGLFTEDDVQSVNDRVEELLTEENPDAIIDRQEYSPEHPDAVIDAYRRDSIRRKPGPGMLLDAASAMNLNLKKSWLVGDVPRDIEAGHAAGCRTVLLRDVTIEQDSHAVHDKLKVPPDYIAGSLADAIDFIEMHTDPHQVRDAARARVGNPKDQLGTDPGADAYENDATLILASIQADAVTDEQAQGSRQPTKDRTSRIDDSSGDPQTSDADREAKQAFSNLPALTIAERAAATLLAAVGASTAPVTQANVLDAQASKEPSRSAATKAATTTHHAQLTTPSSQLSRSEQLLERLVEEVRRAADPPQEFSIAKMLAGVVQGFALAAFFAAVIFRNDPGTFSTLIGVAVFLQLLVTSLIVMGR